MSATAPTRPQSSGPTAHASPSRWSVNYEEGSEYSTLDGDPAGETSGESPSPLGAGERDLANESFFEYGSRVGVWRIMDILDRNNVPSTFYACALALERNPEVGPEAIRRGHEVMGHGNRWEEYYRMDRDAERQAIREAVDTIERICGQRPLGWYTRYGPSVNTRELVVEEGGFEYDCNAYNDDLPYWTEVHGNPWLVVPYSLEVNDYKYWRGDLLTPEHFFQVAKAVLRPAIRGGRNPPQDDVRRPALPHHRQAQPRPALDQFLKYASEKEGVWFARRLDIARWWKEHYPASI